MMERELEYHSGELLEAAKKHGWIVLSMKKDFKRVF